MTPSPDSTAPEAEAKQPESIQDLLSQCYWTASVFHQWEEGRGARKFTNSAMPSVDGEFPTEAKALQAAKDAIANRTVKTRGHSINYARATPYASFYIPHKLQAKIGKARDATRQESGEDSKRLDWLEEQTRLSRTGVSFDYCRWVEDGHVVEKGFRYMRHHHLGERNDSIRAAIDSAMSRKEAK